MVEGGPGYLVVSPDIFIGGIRKNASRETMQVSVLQTGERDRNPKVSRGMAHEENFTTEAEGQPHFPPKANHCHNITKSFLWCLQTFEFSIPGRFETAGVFMCFLCVISLLPCLKFLYAGGGPGSAIPVTGVGSGYQDKPPSGVGGPASSLFPSSVPKKVQPFY